MSPIFQGDPGDKKFNYVLILESNEKTYDFLQGFSHLVDVASSTNIFKVVEPHSLVSPLDTSATISLKYLINFQDLEISKADYYTDIESWCNINKLRYKPDMDTKKFNEDVIFISFIPLKFQGYFSCLIGDLVNGFCMKLEYNSQKVLTLCIQYFPELGIVPVRALHTLEFLY